MSYIPGFSRSITCTALGASTVSSVTMDPQTNQEWGRTAIVMADGDPPEPDVPADVTAVGASTVGLWGGVGASAAGIE